jgi:hypothetical protein
MKQVQEGWSGSFSFSLSVLLADVPEGITPEDMSPEEKLVREEVTTAKEAINRSLISSLIGILNWAKQSGNDFVIKCVHYLFQSFAYQGSYTIFTDEQYTCLSLIVQSIPREKAAFLTTFFQEQAKRGTLVDLPDFDIEIDSQLEALHQYSSRVNNPTALKRKTTAPPKEDSESDDDTPPFIKALLQALNKRGLLEEESPPHTVLPLRVTTEGGFDRGVSSGSGSEVVSVASTKEGEETKEGKKTEESEKSGDSDGCKTQAVIPEFEDPSFSDVSTTSQGREGVILTTVLKKGRKEERINIIDDENNDEEDEVFLSLEELKEKLQKEALDYGNGGEEDSRNGDNDMPSTATVKAQEPVITIKTEYTSTPEDPNSWLEENLNNKSPALLLGLDGMDSGLTGTA